MKLPVVLGVILILGLIVRYPDSAKAVIQDITDSLASLVAKS